MRKQLDAMLISYNLTNKADFPTIIQNKSCTATDNIFINTVHFHNFLITALVNGFSDHNTQLLTTETINLTNLTNQFCVLLQETINKIKNKASVNVIGDSI
jgi:hypothetical protein